VTDVGGFGAGLDVEREIVAVPSVAGVVSITLNTLLPLNWCC
jgi:hypothetical protein